jgi:hypothetical protein
MPHMHRLQVLYLPLMRKQPGYTQTIPILEQLSIPLNVSNKALRSYHIFHSTNASPAFTMRILWSVNVSCIVGTIVLGMWHVVQFFVATGQAAP